MPLALPGMELLLARVRLAVMTVPPVLIDRTGSAGSVSVGDVQRVGADIPELIFRVSMSPSPGATESVPG